jgi:hypothetical protein
MTLEPHRRFLFGDAISEVYMLQLQDGLSGQRIGRLEGVLPHCRS